MKREVRWVDGVVGAAARVGMHPAARPDRTIELSAEDLEALEWLRSRVADDGEMAHRAIAVLARLTAAA